MVAAASGKRRGRGEPARRGSVGVSRRAAAAVELAENLLVLGAAASRGRLQG